MSNRDEPVVPTEGGDVNAESGQTPAGAGGDSSRSGVGHRGSSTSALEAQRRRTEAARLEALVPHTHAELKASSASPFRALELVLSDHGRVAKDILGTEGVVRLVAILLGVSVLFSLPYGLVLGLEQSWRVGALFLGSLMICLPSLQVFSNFIGIRIDIQRNLALTLLVTSVAAAFSFGFFPILWFLQGTMADGEAVGLAGLSVFFLGSALTAGIIQLLRCLGVIATVTEQRSSLVLIAIWLVLLVFVTYRMADVLGLLQ